MSHFVIRCTCGIVITQCRCIGPKTEKIQTPCIHIKPQIPAEPPERIREILSNLVGEYNSGGNLPSDEALARELDTILAVIKGLPAMQEEPASERADLWDTATWNQWRGRNALRRQILAELGIKN